ncbi:MAG: hypothetical protein GC168_14165 [Candidatus Hydrogenedens sp.]|nr:hypothetical protein [Candidatus Hydrogenedens sp.]
MDYRHPKAVRRLLLRILYESYMRDPLNMLSPQDFFDRGLDKQDLAVGMHYLRDAQLAEVMLGYVPPLFNAARITPAGIDLVENRMQFDLRFPEMPGQEEARASTIPGLLERLVAEADLCPLAWSERRALLRDVHYLRDELARPVEQWREHVVSAMMDWIAEPFDDVASVLPVYDELQDALEVVWSGLEQG